MSKTEIAQTVRKRKPAARRYDIIIALLEERLEMMSEIPERAAIEPHITKMSVLFDELRRALGKNAPESDTE